ncbi:heptaprenyl diphosphate synthase [Halalkalibacillus sediminis]|uniref:Heptaprenyl diphosphate synthase component 2 n=1 Tax=Halalkalibacillus sediminis TaxID=2018042 RepID=A0A2I0QWY6_9BACI|nr:polyprenyl synthetase family protein [Halalkalibacillus sediminis]PKR78851.1 heptaprenyl diphosphate synthase [Halalkalibacillus sediminis]
MKLQSALSYISQDIQQIEKQIKEVTRTESSMIQVASHHLLEAGGKRIRPVFVLLSSKFGDDSQENIIDVAVALELIHMASLVHDDVIDHSTIRRGKPTVNAKWNNKTAMYTGDYVFARTLELLKPFEGNRLHNLLANAIHELCIGEIEQIRDKYSLDQNCFTYFKRIKRKTALLIATSTQLGAVAANASENVQQHLFRYGYYIGMSYQIIDDILDFTATEKQLGKPVGSDLMNGNLTLPTLLAFKDLSIYESVKAYFNNPANDAYSADINETIIKIRESEAIEQAYQMSRKYLDKALHEISFLPDQRAKKSLKQIANYLGKRQT